MEGGGGGGRNDIDLVGVCVSVCVPHTRNDWNEATEADHPGWSQRVFLSLYWVVV